MSTASNLTSNHSHAIAEKFYAREALDQLMAKAQFHRFGQMDDIQRGNGTTIQWFRDSLLGTNITAATEGTIGTGLTGGGSVVSATVSQYRDFMTFSDMLRDTALDDRITAQAKNLGYRAAMSVDTIIRNVIDAGAQSQTPGAATSLARTDLSQAVHVMQALNIEPREGGYFDVVCSPYVTYDLVNDTATGSIQDLNKGNGDPSFMNREDRGFVGTYEQYKIWESTNVTVTDLSPDKFRTYIFGKGGYGVVNLAGRGPSKIVDPKNQRFNLKVKRITDIDVANPEGVIAGILSYNFVFTAVSLDSTNKRMRYIDTQSTIVT